MSNMRLTTRRLLPAGVGIALAASVVAARDADSRDADLRKLAALGAARNGLQVSAPVQNHPSVQALPSGSAPLQSSAASSQDSAQLPSPSAPGHGLPL